MNRVTNQAKNRWLTTIPLLFAMAAGLPGCYFGLSSNPFRLGNLPANDIVRTHAKPGCKGAYRDFDPAAKTLKVTPIESINPVRTQHVLVATVCDKDGNGRRNRRVEWHVSGVGHIVEVDETGIFSGRGYLVDDKYAVSYTNYKQHKLTRGNEDPRDDVEIKPGQTWLVITSAEEGETYVTCYAPGIYDWEKHKVFVVKHWVDVRPCFPPPAVNPAGKPHTFVTRLTRSSDGSPVAGYRVRYRIIDGPPAVLEPGGGRQVDVASDPAGNAAVVLKQVQPTIGVNRISVEVIRPSDKNTGKETLVARHETSKTWVAAQLQIQKTAPATAAVGQQIPYTITVTNTGTMPTAPLTIRDTLPPSVQFVGAQPPATQQGSNLIWSFGPLAPRQSATVQFGCVANAAGTVTNCAEAITADGASMRDCVATQVVTGSLQITKTGPQTAVVGQQVPFSVVVTNRGDGPAVNVVVTDSFDSGFVHETGTAPVQIGLGTLGPGESRTLPIVLVPRVAGRLCNRATVQAEGGLRGAAEHCVEIGQPKISIEKTGPRNAFVGAPVEFAITVRNSASIPATNVLIRDNMPIQLHPQQASDGGSIQGNAVTWNLGTLAGGETRTVRVLATAVDVGSDVCNTATIATDGGVSLDSQPVCLNIRGIPALLSEVIDRLDPVPMGAETTYTIRITNQGSMPADGVVLNCKLPDGLEFVDAEGAVAHRYQAATRTVTFEPFNGMAPRKSLTYQVQAKAVRPGDHRFEAKIESDILKKPVLIQESTTVFDPKTGAISAAPSPEADELRQRLAEAKPGYHDADNSDLPTMPSLDVPVIPTSSPLKAMTPEVSPLNAMTPIDSTPAPAPTPKVSIEGAESQAAAPSPTNDDAVSVPEEIEASKVNLEPAIEIESPTVELLLPE